MPASWLRWLKGRTWLQFSLRGLLIVITLASIWLAIIANRARKQAEAIKAIQSLGGTITFDYQLDINGQGRSAAKAPAPVWLHESVAEEYFRRVVHVTILAAWDNKGQTYISPATDELLVHFKNLPHVTTLELRFAEVTGRGIQFLPRGLESLDLTYAPVGDEDLAHLEGMIRLKSLKLGHNRITDEGLKSLSKLTTLEVLTLPDNDITDAGLDRLKSLRNLQFINVMHTNVTAKGVAAFETAHPSCHTTCPSSDWLAKKVPSIVELWPDDYKPSKKELLAKVKEMKWYYNRLSLDPPDEVTGLNFRVVHSKSILRVLKEVPEIKNLEVYDTLNADLLAKELPRYSKLERLSINDCDLTDDALVHLGKLTNLVELSLNGTHVTDARLDELARLKNLATLGLSHTRVSQQGCMKLRKQLPYCLIGRLGE